MNSIQDADVIIDAVRIIDQIETIREAFGSESNPHSSDCASDRFEKRFNERQKVAEKRALPIPK